MKQGFIQPYGSISIPWEFKAAYEKNTC